MALPKKDTQTPKKRPAKPFNGKEDGVCFTKENQPTGEQKKLGWEKWRAQRNLTQSIIAEMSEGTNLKEYIKSLVTNAKMGNPKAIDTVNRCIEDDITKIEHSGTVSLAAVGTDRLAQIEKLLNDDSGTD